MAYTLIESCKAADVEPFAYLADVLTRLPGLRVGDYRVIYEIDDARELVSVTRARHRREVYR